MARPDLVPSVSVKDSEQLGLTTGRIALPRRKTKILAEVDSRFSHCRTHHSSSVALCCR